MVKKITSNKFRNSEQDSLSSTFDFSYRLFTILFSSRLSNQSRLIVINYRKIESVKFNDKQLKSVFIEVPAQGKVELFCYVKKS